MRKRNYTAVFRIMHWLLAFSMICMLLTVFLRLNWMNKDHISGIIQNYFFLKGQPLPLSQGELTELAKQIRKPMWNWHIYIGYFLVGLYALRIVLSFFGIMKFENPTKKGTYKLKEKFQFWVYLVFYICLAVSLITGLFIELSDNAYKKIVEEIHKLSIYYLIAFIVIHLAGVLIAEFTNQQGIISKMISGKKKAIKE